MSWIDATLFLFSRKNLKHPQKNDWAKRKNKKSKEEKKEGQIQMHCLSKEIHKEIEFDKPYEDTHRPIENQMPGMSESGWQKIFEGPYAYTLGRKAI